MVRAFPGQPAIFQRDPEMFAHGDGIRMQPKAVVFQAESTGDLAFGDLIGLEGAEALAGLRGTHAKAQGLSSGSTIGPVSLTIAGAGGATGATATAGAIRLPRAVDHESVR